MTVWASLSAAPFLLEVMRPELVIGVVGLKAAGKDSFSRLLRERGFGVRTMSDFIKSALAAEGNAAPTVSDLQDWANARRAETGDTGCLATLTVDSLLAEGHRRLAVDGIRNPGEIEALRRRCGDRLVLVGLVAPTSVRFRRAVARGKPSDPVAFEDWLTMDDRDRGLGEPPEGQQVDRCLALVPHENVFNNAGTPVGLEAWTDGLLARVSALA